MAAKPRNETKNQDDPRGQFGAFLRDWIDAKHDGDEKRLATMLDMSDRAVRLWMAGDTGPAFSDLGRVAKALGYADWAALAAAVVRHHRKHG
jgi:hypothetical protein